MVQNGCIYDDICAISNKNASWRGYPAHCSNELQEKQRQEAVKKALAISLYAGGRVRRSESEASSHEQTTTVSDLIYHHLPIVSHLERTA